jgi:tetratricopeptide (TPR) repeat protein
VEQIKARLGDRFRLLTRAGGGAPSRQQTVLAVIQWSWDHLLAPERDLFRRLAVFTGGWTLERATAVCEEHGDEFEVLDLLTRLAERSLVVLQRAEDGSVRYRFLESVWRFALEQLETHLEHAPLRERHLATYLAFAERAEKAMTGAGLQQALRELMPEEENILAAFAWCAHADDGVEHGLRLASAVSRFWSLLGRFSIGRRVLEEALARDTTRRPTPIRSLALVRASGFALMAGDHATARPHLEESLANCRAAGDRKGIARALAGLCVTAMWQSRYEEALELGEGSLALYREIGEQRGVAMALHNLGSIEGSLKRPDHGRARLEAALELLRALEDKGTQALCLGGLADALLRVGDLAGARARMRECMALLDEMDLARESYTLLEALAGWLLATGQPVESARMMGAAAGIRVAIGSPALPSERADGEQLRASLAAAIGEDVEGRAHAEGVALSREQALSEARRLLDSVQSD